MRIDGLQYPRSKVMGFQQTAKVKNRGFLRYVGQATELGKPPGSGSRATLLRNDFLPTLELPQLEEEARRDARG